MTNLLTRKPFLEETASLFTDEKTATARNKIIDLLNKAAVGSTKQIIETIIKVQELIVHSDGELLDEFLDNILTFSQNSIQDVRKNVVAFIEEVCKAKIQFLPRVINILSMFIRDSSPLVIKRVIQACASVYRNAIKWLSTTSEITDDVEIAWTTLCLMKAQILDMIDNDNDGIRTNAIKFLEGIVILQTYPDEDSVKRPNDFSLDDVPLTLKIARRRKLEDEALNIFDLLLKFHAASHISSVNLIACTGTLCTIGKLRPSLLHSVIDALKNLNINLPPTLTDSQVSSVKKHMKMQLVNILKLPSAFEFQSTIIQILSDLGVSNQEIARTLPKLDRQEQQRRTKRALENANAAANAAKKAKLDKDETTTNSSTTFSGGLLSQSSIERNKMELFSLERQMEIDLDEIDEQKLKSNKINENFIVENLRSIDLIIKMVMTSMKNLPNEIPLHFITNYTPIVNLSLPVQVKKIAETLSQQMTDKRVGPGANAFSKEPPMRPKVSLEEEKIIIQSGRNKEIDQQLTTQTQSITELIMSGETHRDDDNNEIIDKNIVGDDELMDGIEIETRKEEATKKLRETLERVKGEQSAMIPRMKLRVKTLKLQEVTKPLSRSVKEQFLIDSVKRILNSERQCIVGGVAAKRRKILTVLAATFTQSVRDIIFKYITDDLKGRIDLAFSWLYEEYSLLQGFVRHSHIKSENKPDYAYNLLFNELIKTILEISDLGEKEKLLQRIYLEAPIISEEAIIKLIGLCELVDLSNCGMELIKDLSLLRPTKQERFLQILLKYAVHENVMIREKSIENLITLYAVHKSMVEKIEVYALLWLHYLEQPNAPATMFNVEYGRPKNQSNNWSEDLAKVCLLLFLSLMPYREELIQDLSQVYINTTADMKRIILRAIETPIRTMGSDSFEILRLIEQCPKGTETLVTRIIYILTEKSDPTVHLVTKVRELYQNKVPDVRLLIPVLSGLTKKEILTALPKFIKLNPVVMREVFNRLLGLGQDFKNTTIPISSTELLVALHTIDSKVELKFIVKATSLCLTEKDTYTQDILVLVLQQLVEMIPLPTLLMRTVIQSLTLYPRLANFIVTLLQRLITKQVWKQKVVWDGFLKCCQRLQPQSFPVLLQLPIVQLTDALILCPDLRQPLLEHAKNLTETTPVSDVVMAILSSTPEKKVVEKKEEIITVSEKSVSNPQEPEVESKTIKPPGLT